MSATKTDRGATVYLGSGLVEPKEPCTVLDGRTYPTRGQDNFFSGDVDSFYYCSYLFLWNSKTLDMYECE